jgi:hypothetical protein
LLFTEGHLNVKFGDERATYQTILLPVLPLEEAEAWKARQNSAQAATAPAVQADSAA